MSQGSARSKDGCNHHERQTNKQTVIGELKKITLQNLSTREVESVQMLSFSLPLHQSIPQAQ